MKKRYATKEEWYYLNWLVRESGVTTSKVKERIKNEDLLEVVCRNEELVKRYIEDGRDVNTIYSKGITLLIEGCLQGNKSIVKMLLDVGASINVTTDNGYSLLHIACQNGDKSMVEMLLDRGIDIDVVDNNGCSSLYIACIEGNEDIVKLLLDSGANIEIVDKRGSGPLHVVCFQGNKSMVEMLLDRGADINSNTNTKEGGSPLHVACQKNYKEIVEMLIKRGANVNVIGKDKASPLHLACQWGYTTLVEILLNEGADIEMVDNYGRSPVYVACFKGHIDLVKLLLSRGANINIRDFRECGLLHIACVQGDKAMLEVLLERGIYIDKQPLEIARHCRHKNIVNILQKEMIQHNLLESYVKGEELIVNKLAVERKVERLIKTVRGMTDQEIIVTINIFSDRLLKILVKKIGGLRMSKILNKIENEDKCIKIVNEIYMSISSSCASGKAKELLNEKVYQDISYICKKGTNTKKLKNLLNVADITDDFLVDIINISNDDTLKVLVLKVDIRRISNVFERINEKKRYSIVDKLYQVKNILDLTSGYLRKELENKIKNELIKAHMEGKEAYRNELLNTGIDVAVLDTINRPLLFKKELPSSGELSLSERIEKTETLIDAILIGDRKKINLLKHNKDEVNRVDKSGKNALMYAIEKGDTKIAIELINNDNVDVNARDKDGKNVLMYSVEKNYEDMARILAEKTNVYDRDTNNKSVLMYALQKGNSMLCIINPLIGDAHYEDKDNKGVSILMYACQGGYMPAVKKLVDMIPEDDRSRILDYKIKGTTPLRVAGENNNEEVAKYLLKNGAVDHGSLSGDKLNRLMIWWAEVDYKREHKDNVVIEQVHIGNYMGRDM